MLPHLPAVLALQGTWCCFPDVFIAALQGSLSPRRHHTRWLSLAHPNSLCLAPVCLISSPWIRPLLWACAGLCQCLPSSAGHSSTAGAPRAPSSSMQPCAAVIIPWVSHPCCSATEAFPFPTLLQHSRSSIVFKVPLFFFSFSLPTFYSHSLLVSNSKGNAAAKLPAGLPSLPCVCMGREEGRDQTWRHSWLLCCEENEQERGDGNVRPHAQEITGNHR